MCDEELRAWAEKLTSEERGYLLVALKAMRDAMEKGEKNVGRPWRESYECDFCGELIEPGDVCYSGGGVVVCHSCMEAETLMTREAVGCTVADAARARGYEPEIYGRRFC